MPSYTAPVDDMMFLFEKLRDNKNYNELEKYKEVNSELVKDILEEAAKINQNLILPLAKAGDETPAILENGVVRTPPGYKEAYQKYIEDGWTSLSCDPKYGGQGMPRTVSAFFDEMMSSSSLAFKLYSELTLGAYNCIHHHATDEIKDKFLPKMVQGKWSGTMCLTEPVCGTDLGLLKTKAVEQSDGTYKISGQKIAVPDGDIADFAVVSATSGKNIGLFLVNLKDDKVIIETLDTFDPSRSHANITFDNADGMLLEDDAWTSIEKLLDQSAVLFAFEQVGGAEASMNMAKEYAMGRYCLLYTSPSPRD